MDYIEFVHTDKSLQKNLKREQFQSIDMNVIRHTIAANHFSGIATVYIKNKMCFKICVTEGKLNGQFIKYEEFTPTTLYGSATGVIAGWTQPVLIANYRVDLLDGPLTIYSSDGTKQYIFNYNMGILDGIQKHYAAYSKCEHLYSKGNHVKSTKISKSWLWSDDSNEFDSHLQMVKQHHRNLKL
jgi:antitoxin component YwqK of YwqJK toxin-antitoxin module